MDYSNRPIGSSLGKLTVDPCRQSNEGVFQNLPLALRLWIGAMSHTPRSVGRHSALLKVVSETQDLRVFSETGNFRASSYVLPFDIPVRIENRISLQPKKQQEDDDSYTNERSSQSLNSTNVFSFAGSLDDSV